MQQRVYDIRRRIHHAIWLKTFGSDTMLWQRDSDRQESNGRENNTCTQKSGRMAETKRPMWGIHCIRFIISILCSVTDVVTLLALQTRSSTRHICTLRVNMSKLCEIPHFDGNGKITNPGTLDAIVKMIRYEGLAGFYKGMGTKIVQSVFAASVLFMIKEELVKLARTVVNKNRKIVQKFSIKLV